MNRADRRRLKKLNKGQNIHINDAPPNEDKRNENWCNRHKLALDNIDRPTERDEKLIESVRFRTKKTLLEDGTTRVFKQCPRCLRTIDIDIIKTPLLAE